MEDRLTPGLYLEMTDLSARDYARGHLPQVLRLPRVERATWWVNAHRGRTDLPRGLPEFEHLGVYEVSEGFTAPATPPGVTGYHFRRYRRPGQGILTGKATIGLLLVLISPSDPVGAQDLRDWADFVHLRHIAEAAVPGYGMITPYENVALGDPRFLHFYEMDCEDPEAAFQAMTPLVAKRLGGNRSAEFKHWATHPQLDIMYVNTFKRLGQATPR